MQATGEVMAIERNFGAALNKALRGLEQSGAGWLSEDPTWSADLDALASAFPSFPPAAPIVAADGRALARAVRVLGKVDPVFVEHVADLPAAIRSAARDGDAVLATGAGSIGTVAGRLASESA